SAREIAVRVSTLRRGPSAPSAVFIGSMVFGMRFATAFAYSTRVRTASGPDQASELSGQPLGPVAVNGNCPRFLQDCITPLMAATPFDGSLVAPVPAFGQFSARADAVTYSIGGRMRVIDGFHAAVSSSAASV